MFYNPPFFFKLLHGCQGVMIYNITNQQSCVFFFSFVAIFYKGKGINVNMPEKVKLYDNKFCKFTQRIEKKETDFSSQENLILTHFLVCTDGQITQSNILVISK